MATSQETRTPPGEDHGGQKVPSTRTSVSWTFVAIGIAALIVILVFILENLHSVDAAFFGIHWRIPLGLDLLLAALLGALAVFVVGAARVIQLRLLARRRGGGTGRRSRRSTPPTDEGASA